MERVSLSKLLSVTLVSIASSREDIGQGECQCNFHHRIRKNEVNKALKRRSQKNYLGPITHQLQCGSACDMMIRSLIMLFNKFFEIRKIPDS